MLPVLYFTVVILLSNISAFEGFSINKSYLSSNSGSRLFVFGRQSPSASTKKSVKGPNAEAAIAVYKKANPNPRSGGSYDLTEELIVSRYNALADITKDELIALNIVQTAPYVLTITSNLCKDNFDVFSEKFGEDGALGLITRNPLILGVPTRGYGSAETAGKETIAGLFGNKHRNSWVRIPSAIFETKQSGFSELRHAVVVKPVGFTQTGCFKMVFNM
eukprot:gene11984-16042_t